MHLSNTATILRYIYKDIIFIIMLLYLISYLQNVIVWHSVLILNFQVPEVFYFAQKAVLYPVHPLYCHESQALTDRCVRALRRIFVLCDSDMDDALNDAELNDFQVFDGFSISFFFHILWTFSAFIFSPFTYNLQIYQQVRCFNVALKSSEIEGIKTVVHQNVPEGINSRGLTFPGFLYVHTMFLRQQRAEALWAVLRSFGYDIDLKLQDHFLLVPSKNASDQVMLSFFVLLLWKFHFYLSIIKLVQVKFILYFLSSCPIFKWYV